MTRATIRERLEHSKLSRLVALFGEEMREKLWEKQKQGREGWDDDSDSALEEDLTAQLMDCMKRFTSGDDKNQFVDIANLAAMLWNLQRLQEKKKSAR